MTKKNWYYNQYKSILMQSKLGQTLQINFVTDNLKLDGTAAGFIERQKVLKFEKEYLAWKKV